MTQNVKLTEFQIAATFLGLSQQEQDSTLAMMSKLGVGLNDLNSMPLVTAVKLASEVNRLRDEFKEETATLAARIKSGVGAVVHNELASTPEALARNVEAAMKGIEDRLATSVDTKADQRAARRDTIKVSQIALGVAVAMFLAGAAGYVVGRDAINAQAARWEALARRTDSAAIMRFAAANDFNRVQSECGATGQFELQGVPACQPKLRLSPPLNNTEGVNGLLLLWTQITVKLGVLGLLGVGAICGFLGARWFAKSRQGY